MLVAYISVGVGDASRFVLEIPHVGVREDANETAYAIDCAAATGFFSSLFPNLRDPRPDCRGIRVYGAARAYSSSSAPSSSHFIRLRDRMFWRLGRLSYRFHRKLGRIARLQLGEVYRRIGDIISGPRRTIQARG